MFNLTGWSNSKQTVGALLTAVCINVDTFAMFGRSRKFCKPSVGLALSAEQPQDLSRCEAGWDLDCLGISK